MPTPIALTDAQLRLVMTAARGRPSRLYNKIVEQENVT
jgi:hypothetical protein